TMRGCAILDRPCS
ncbi:porphyromonas-type peptidyl-arginine deiminase family protein, partial [Vibrio parahaemolyticus V-223/04]